jgi:uncharacterized protein YjbI with pentapeptide repeats
MAEGPPVPWESCSEPGCIGSQLQHGQCVGHLEQSSPELFDRELKRIAEHGSIDARGVRLSAALLRRLLKATPHEGERMVLAAAQFERATFDGEVDFGRAIFRGEADFSNATFQGDVNFSDASFEDKAIFGEAVFHQRAQFNTATFQRNTSFVRATFEDVAWFLRATFQGPAVFLWVIFRKEARFDQASFQSVAEFGMATFEGPAGFPDATFLGNAVGFSRASFEDEVWFYKASFQSNALFIMATFAEARSFGLLIVRKQLVLDGAVFQQRIQIDAVAGAVCCRRAQFPAGVHFRLRWANITLEEANLAAPAILTSVPPFPHLAERELASRWKRLPPGPRGLRWRTRLLSVARADVAGLRISNVDLRACRFVGAHNLDRLRVEGAPVLAGVPGWWRARRTTIAEEQYWRATRHPSQRKGWYPSSCRLPAGVDPPSIEDPLQIAAVYRDLRKGREDAKDEPGAGDFYYGEMEMRRHAARPWSVERALITVYWLISGYALRAWRTFATLTLAIVTAALIFATVGFNPPSSPRFVPVDVTTTGRLIYQRENVGPPSFRQQLPRALGYSAEVATSLLRGPDRPVTAAGEWTQAILRWLGPALFALALLSLRGRVKR